MVKYDRSFNVLLFYFHFCIVGFEKLLKFDSVMPKADFFGYVGAGF